MKNLKGMQLGWLYRYGITNYVYIGDVYVWAEDMATTIKDDIEFIDYSNEPAPYHIYATTNSIPKGVKTIKEYLNSIHVSSVVVDDYIHFIKTPIKIEEGSLDWIAKYSFSSIATSKKVLENDMTKEDFEDFFERLREESNDYLESNFTKNDEIVLINEILFGTATDEVPIDFTDEQKRFFDIANKKTKLMKNKETVFYHL